MRRLNADEICAGCTRAANELTGSCFTRRCQAVRALIFDEVESLVAEPGEVVDHCLESLRIVALPHV